MATGGIGTTADAPGIREALWIGSPEFIGQAGEGGAEEKSGKREERRARTAYRYLSRMAFRPTPFGLFAGYSLGETGKETRLQILGQEYYDAKRAWILNTCTV